MAGSSPSRDRDPAEKRRGHLRVVRSREESEEPTGQREPRRPWPIMARVLANLAAVAFVAWVGYRRSGRVGGIVLVAAGLLFIFGIRRAADAAARVARRGRRPHV